MPTEINTHEQILHFPGDILTEGNPLLSRPRIPSLYARIQRTEQTTRASLRAKVVVTLAELGEYLVSGGNSAMDCDDLAIEAYEAFIDRTTDALLAAPLTRTHSVEE